MKRSWIGFFLLLVLLGLLGMPYPKERTPNFA